VSLGFRAASALKICGLARSALAQVIDAHRAAPLLEALSAGAIETGLVGNPWALMGKPIACARPGWRGHSEQGARVRTLQTFLVEPASTIGEWQVWRKSNFANDGEVGVISAVTRLI
jgi:hypothetical protein